MHTRIQSHLALVLLLFSATIGAQETGKTTAATHNGGENYPEIRRVIKSLVPDQEIRSVRETPVAGLYEVTLGAEVLYISKDGQYIIQGDLIHAKERKSLTEERRGFLRQDILKTVNTNTEIIFAPKKTRHIVTIFTDIDCGYCRKLHQEMAEYNNLGIEIRYLAYPRSGLFTDSYNKAVTVWCSTDRKQALTESKSGKTLKSKTCENPVKAHYELGQKLGISGTPALLLEDGTLLPGYIPPARLAAMLDKKI